MCEWRRRLETPKRYEIWDPPRQEDPRPRKDRLVPKHPNMNVGPQALRKERLDGKPHSWKTWLGSQNPERSIGYG